MAYRLDRLSGIITRTMWSFAWPAISLGMIFNNRDSRWVIARVAFFVLMVHSHLGELWKRWKSVGPAALMQQADSLKESAELSDAVSDQARVAWLRAAIAFHWNFTYRSSPNVVDPQRAAFLDRAELMGRELHDLGLPWNSSNAWKTIVSAQPVDDLPVTGFTDPPSQGWRPSGKERRFLRKPTHACGRMVGWQRRG